MPNVSSLRPLVTGSGTISSTSWLSPGNNVIVFSQPQNFKEGATLATNTGVVTVDTGSGTTWKMRQTGNTGNPSGSFHTSDTSSTRARGGGATYLPPLAPLFAYVSMRDPNGNPDFYLYMDTLFPENGVHPYTRDQWTGKVTMSDSAGSQLLTDLPTRLRVHEGRLNALDLNPTLSQSLIGDPWTSGL
jgi:hypothetical protein